MRHTLEDEKKEEEVEEVIIKRLYFKYLSEVEK
jgi:hypothetical protein